MGNCRTRNDQCRICRRKSNAGALWEEGAVDAGKKRVRVGGIRGTSIRALQSMVAET